MSDVSEIVVISGEIYVGNHVSGNGNRNGNGNGSRHKGKKGKQDNDLRLLRDTPHVIAGGISFDIEGFKNVTREGVLLAVKRVRSKGQTVTYETLNKEGVEHHWVEHRFGSLEAAVKSAIR